MVESVGAGGSPLLVGLDVGTTNVKAVVCDLTGRTVALASVPQEALHPRPGWSAFDPERLWELACEVLRRVVRQVDRPDQIVGVGVASFGEAGVLMDDRGRAVDDVIAWYDDRSLPQAERFAAVTDPDEMFRRTGAHIQSIMSLCKLMWIRDEQPEVWARGRKWLNIADYVNYRLCGTMAQSPSLGARTSGFDLTTMDWACDLLAAAGIPRSVLADPAPGGSALGTVHAEASAVTGLPVTAVVGMGGHDHICGAFAAGAVSAGDLLDSMGTSEAVVTALDHPIQDAALGRMGYSQGAHAVPGRYYVYGGLYTAGACVDWVRGACNGGSDHASMLLAAAEVPAGSGGVLFVPHLRLANTPNADPKSRAAFVGLTAETTTAALTRAVIEGVAFEGRASIDPLAAFAGLEHHRRINVIGGTARNRLLLEIKASVMNARLELLAIDEAAALGGAMLGGLAAGSYASVEEATSAVRTAGVVIEPNARVVAYYDKLYSQVYREMYAALRPVNHRLYDLLHRVEA